MRRILVALLFSVVLQGVAIAAKGLLVPVHERGTAQVALSPFIAVASIPIWSATARSAGAGSC